MARLNISVKYDDLGVNTALDNQTAILQIGTLLVANAQSDKLISTDQSNALELGSDNKLYVNDADKLATTYNYADSVSTFWSI